MSAADEAYEFARQLIAEAKRTGAGVLSFDREETRALEVLPPEIGALEGVTWLHLANTQVADLAPLAGLTGIRTLLLDNTQVADLAPLAGLTGIAWLSLANTQVANLAPLAGLTGIEWLSLDDTQVANLAPLTGLTGITHLGLSGSRVLDLRPIRTLKGLVENPVGNGLIFDDTPATGADARIARLAEFKRPKQRARELFKHLEDWQPPGDARPKDIEATLRGPILAASLTDITKTGKQFEATALADEPDRAQDARYADLLGTVSYAAARLGKTDTANRIGKDIAQSFVDYHAFSAQEPLNARLLNYLAQGLRAVVGDPDLADALDAFDRSKVTGFLSEHDALMREYFSSALVSHVPDVTTDPETLIAELFPRLGVARKLLEKADADGLFAPSVSDALEILHRRAEGARKRFVTAHTAAERENAVGELRRTSVLVTAYLGRIKGRILQWLGKQGKHTLENPLSVAGNWSKLIEAANYVVIHLTPIFEALWHMIGNLPLPF